MDILCLNYVGIIIKAIIDRCKVFRFYNILFEKLDKLIENEQKISSRISMEE